MTAAACHPDRPHLARGLCSACYKTLWRSVRRAEARRRIRCTICDQRFPAQRRNASYCSPLCQRVGIWLSQQRRRGTKPEGEEIITTKDREFAAAVARTARDRGCRRIRPKAPCTDPAYFSAWHRGEGLYVIRVRWPGGERVTA